MPEETGSRPISEVSTLVVGDHMGILGPVVFLLLHCCTFGFIHAEWRDGGQDGTDVFILFRVMVLRVRRVFGLACI